MLLALWRTCDHMNNDMKSSRRVVVSWIRSNAGTRSIITIVKLLDSMDAGERADLISMLEEEEK